MITGEEETQENMPTKEEQQKQQQQEEMNREQQERESSSGQESQPEKKQRDPTLVGEAHQRLLEQQMKQQQFQQPDIETETVTLSEREQRECELCESPDKQVRPFDREVITKAGLEGSDVTYETPEELARGQRELTESERARGGTRIIASKQQQVPVPGGVRQETFGVAESEKKRVHVVEQGPGEAIVIKPKPNYFYQAQFLPGQRIAGQPIVRDATIDMFNSLVAKNTHCLLGRTGVKVSRMCLGSMNFGRIDPQFGDRPGQLEEVEAHRILDRYVELGGNCIDTASFFPWFGSCGESERIIGSWLEKQPRERLFIIDKVRMPLDPTDVNSGGLSRAHILDTVRRSLKHLRTDYIDMFMLNGWDPTVSVHETVRHLNELIENGLVRYIGVCDFKGWQLQKFIDAARMMNMHKCVCYMGEYNLLTRGLEWEVIDVCRTERIGFFAYAPFKYGFLTKLYNPESSEPIEGTRIQSATETPNLVSMAQPFEEMRSNPIYEALLNVCQRIGRARNLTNSQIALLWSLQRGFVTSCVIGISSTQELDESMSLLSGDVTLTCQEMMELDQASRFRMHYPYTLNLSSVAGYKEIDPRQTSSFEQLSFVNEFVPFEQLEQMRLNPRETYHESPWQIYPERQKFGEPSIQQFYEQPPQGPLTQTREERLSRERRSSPLQEQQRLGLQQSQEQTLQAGKDQNRPILTTMKAQSAQFPPQRT